MLSDVCSLDFFDKKKMSHFLHSTPPFLFRVVLLPVLKTSPRLPLLPSSPFVTPFLLFVLILPLFRLLFPTPLSYSFRFSSHSPLVRHKTLLLWTLACSVGTAFKLVTRNWVPRRVKYAACLRSYEQLKQIFCSVQWERSLIMNGILVRKGKTPLGRRRRTWEDNIRIDLGPELWRQGVKLTTHFHLATRLRMRGAIPPLHQYVFMVWCLIKQWGGLNATDNALHSNPLMSHLLYTPFKRKGGLWSLEQHESCMYPCTM
jgi:hypothetical protein